MGQLPNIVANHPEQLESTDSDKAILHYALPLLGIASGKSIDSDERSELLSHESTMAVCTLFIDRQRLLSRIDLRYKRLIRDLFKLRHLRNILKECRRLRRLRALLMQDKNVLDRVYRAWFRYCDQKLPGRHYVIDVNQDEPRLVEDHRACVGF